MTSRDFCYWLQGFYELSTANAPTSALTPEQSSMVKRHLALVFKHEIDPSIDGGKPDLAQAMQAVHDGKPAFPHLSGKHGGPVYRC